MTDLAVFLNGSWDRVAIGTGIAREGGGRRMKWARLALALAVLAGTIFVASADEQAATGLFAGHGVVRAVAPTTGDLTLAHEDIKGFMPAMEMMYRVRTPDLSKDLRPGDIVDFTIDAAKYLIVDVKLIAHAR
jgi:Cu/Ag efflux protein CusF